MRKSTEDFYRLFIREYRPRFFREFGRRSYYFVWSAFMQEFYLIVDEVTKHKFRTNEYPKIDVILAGCSPALTDVIYESLVDWIKREEWFSEDYDELLGDLAAKEAEIFLNDPPEDENLVFARGWKNFKKKRIETRRKNDEKVSD